jgi:3-hydroxyisobutyrate dehydrogenase
MKASSSRCWSIDTYNPVPGFLENVPAANDYEGGFRCQLMLKDLGLAQLLAQEAGINSHLGKLTK